MAAVLSLSAVTDAQAEGRADGEDPRASRIEAFAQGLIGKRTEAVTWRAASGVERRWLDDIEAYHGRDEHNRPAGLMDTLAAGAALGANAHTAPKVHPQQVVRSTVYVQLTRQKTNTATARVQEMLFPSDERNWGIQPTPVPELAEALEQGGSAAYVDPQTGTPLPHPDASDGRPLTLADIAGERMREATKRAEAMEKQIADALEECHYVAHGRAAIADAAMIGTAVLKGPVVVNATRRRWASRRDPTGTVRTLTIEQDHRPASFRVSPWDFFPDPSCGENVQDGGYVWEREFASARRLRDLARTQGYDSAAIRECVREGPRRVSSTGHSYYEAARAGDGYNPAPGTFGESRWELWTYVGEVDREDIETLGLPIPEEQRDLASISAIVVLCNDRPIKVALNPMDGGDLPYDVFVWERVALSPFGVGIPYLMRYAQRTINAAWRALLDNMGAASGVQLLIADDVTPYDGNYQIIGRKLWRMPSGRDADKAFKAVEIPSRQADLTNVIRLAMEFADAETALPQIAQGEQGTAPDTVGGMTLLMNAANTVLKRIARQFDDQITKPHIRRYYDWMMQFHPDDSIKGDMAIAARGSTALVTRDMRNQSLTEVIAAATHPVFGMFLDHKKLFRAYLESKSVTPDSVMKSDAEIAQALEEARKAGPAKTPQEKVAEIRAQADVKRVEIDTQSEVTNERLRQENAQRDRDHDMTMRLLDYRTKVLDYVQQRGITLEQFKQELSMLVLEKSIDREEAMIDRAEARDAAASGRAHDLQRESLRASAKEPARAG